MRLVGPVFFKELITLSRHWRHFAVRAAFIGAILLAVGLQNWLLRPVAQAGGYTIYGGFGYGGFVDYATQLGRVVFQAVITFQFWAIVIIVPALAAAVIAGEKERDTLNLLLLTPQRPLRVLVDKLLSRLYYVGLLLLAGLPLMLGLLTFGGVTPEEVLAAYLALIAAIAWCAGIGLLCSAWCHTVTGALLLAFLLLPLAHLGATWWAHPQGLPSANDLSPYDCLAWVTLGHQWRWSSAMYGAIWVDNLVWPAARCALRGLALMLAAVLLSWLLLPHRLAPGGHSFLKQFFAAVDRRCRRVRGVWGKELLGPRPLDRYPVLWRETCKRFSASNGFLVRCLYGVVILGTVSFVTIVSLDLDNEVLDYIPHVWGGFTFGLAALLAARTFTTERERHTLPLLLSTPVTRQAIYLGKLAGVVKSLSVFVLIPAGLLGAVLLVRHDRDDLWVLVWATLALTALGHVVVTGLNASLQRQRTLTALLQTGLSLAVQWLFLGICAGTIYECLLGSGGQAYMERGMTRSYVPDPNLLTAPLTVLDLLRTGYPQRWDGRGDFPPPDHHVSGILLAFVLPLLLALAVRIYLATRTFDRVTGRF